MKTFLQRHEANIYGVLSGFDRIRFRGTHRRIAYRNGVMGLLWLLKVLLMHFAEFMKKRTSRLKKATETLAQKTPLGQVHYLNSSSQSKEEVVRQLLCEHPVLDDFHGLVAVLSCVEPCGSFGVNRNRQEKKLELRSMFRKCLHYYLYIRHPQFGMLHIRIQSWFPFRVQVCMNGREWLARQMDAAGIEYQRQDNTFDWVSDFEGAQRLLDEQLRTNWPEMLSGLVREYHPALVELLKQLQLGDPYWTAEQTEWATDVSFRSAEVLGNLYPRLVRHAVHELGCTDTMRFLQQKLTKHGTIFGQVKKEVVTAFKVRPEGVRVKHRVGANSVKMYDKPGSNLQITVLRVETTIHDAEGLKVYRPTEADPEGGLRWLPLRRGVADLHRRCELSQRANETYLEALAVVDAAETLGTVVTPLGNPATRNGRRFRGLKVMSVADRQVRGVMNRGEYTIMGIRNRDLREALYGNRPRDPQQRKQQSARVSRWFALLQAHGLIRKVHGSHRYTMTEQGRRCASAILTATDATIETLTNAA
jgi:hypothetical protein